MHFSFETKKNINFNLCWLQVANELVISFEEEINAYLNHVVNQTENELGRCGPLANVYKSVVVAGCNRIVNPLVSFRFFFPLSHFNFKNPVHTELQRFNLNICVFLTFCFHLEWVMGRNHNVHSPIFTGNNI